jgi:prephenate dehydratase
VPIENSIEGSVTITLDTLAREETNARIVAEVLLAVRHCLIAQKRIPLEQIKTVISHPHVPGQCTRFLRGELAHARVSVASSTAEAVRQVSKETDHDTAAIGTRLAAEIYGCEILREGIEDRSDNETRFVWLTGANSTASPPLIEDSTEHDTVKTSLVFWGEGASHPGWLVLCLQEFSRRAINLTKVESRPHRERSWRYMFFLDVETHGTGELLREAISGLEELCEEVRVLGSYPAARAS